MSREKLRSDRTVHLFFQLSGSQIRSGDTKFLYYIGQRGYAVVSRERDPNIGETDLMPQEIEEVRKFVIEIKRHLRHLGGVGTDAVPENVVRRKTDREQIGRRSSTDILVDDQLFCEFEL